MPLSWQNLVGLGEGEDVEEFLWNADIGSVIFTMDATILKNALFGCIAKFEKFPDIQSRCFQMLQECHLLAPPGIINEELTARYDAILRQLSSWVTKVDVVLHGLELLSMLADKEIMKKRAVKMDTDEELIPICIRIATVHNSSKPVQRAALQLFEAIIENAQPKSLPLIADRIFRMILDNLLLHADDNSVVFSAFCILLRLAADAKALILPYTDQLINICIEDAIVRRSSPEIAAKGVAFLAYLTEDREAFFTIARHPNGFQLFIDGLDMMRAAHLPQVITLFELLLRVLEDYDIALEAFQHLPVLPNGESMNPVEFAQQFQAQLKEKFEKFCTYTTELGNTPDEEGQLKVLFFLYSQVDELLLEMMRPEEDAEAALDDLKSQSTRRSLSTVNEDDRENDPDSRHGGGGGGGSNSGSRRGILGLRSSSNESTSSKGEKVVTVIAENVTPGYPVSGSNSSTASGSTRKEKLKEKDLSLSEKKNVLLEQVRAHDTSALDKEVRRKHRQEHAEMELLQQELNPAHHSDDDDEDDRQHSQDYVDMMDIYESRAEETTVFSESNMHRHDLSSSQGDVASLASSTKMQAIARTLSAESAVSTHDLQGLRPDAGDDSRAEPRPTEDEEEEVAVPSSGLSAKELVQLSKELNMKELMRQQQEHYLQDAEQQVALRAQYEQEHVQQFGHRPNTSDYDGSTSHQQAPKGDGLLDPGDYQSVSTSQTNSHPTADDDDTTLSSAGGGGGAGPTAGGGVPLGSQGPRHSFLAATFSFLNAQKPNPLSHPNSSSNAMTQQPPLTSAPSHLSSAAGGAGAGAGGAKGGKVTIPPGKMLVKITYLEELQESLKLANVHTRQAIQRSEMMHTLFRDAATKIEELLLENDRVSTKLRTWQQQALQKEQENHRLNLLHKQANQDVQSLRAQLFAYGIMPCAGHTSSSNNNPSGNTGPAATSAPPASTATSGPSSAMMAMATPPPVNNGPRASIMSSNGSVSVASTMTAATGATNATGTTKKSKTPKTTTVVTKEKVKKIFRSPIQAALHLPAAQKPRWTSTLGTKDHKGNPTMPSSTTAALPVATVEATFPAGSTTPAPVNNNNNSPAPMAMRPPLMHAASTNMMMTSPMTAPYAYPPYPLPPYAAMNTPPPPPTGGAGGGGGGGGKDAARAAPSPATNGPPPPGGMGGPGSPMMMMGMPGAPPPPGMMHYAPSFYPYGPYMAPMTSMSMYNNPMMMSPPGGQPPAPYPGPPPQPHPQSMLMRSPDDPANKPFAHPDRRTHAATTSNGLPTWDDVVKDKARQALQGLLQGLQFVQATYHSKYEETANANANASPPVTGTRAKRPPAIPDATQLFALALSCATTTTGEAPAGTAAASSPLPPAPEWHDDPQVASSLRLFHDTLTALATDAVHVFDVMLEASQPVTQKTMKKTASASANATAGGNGQEPFDWSLPPPWMVGVPSRRIRALCEKMKLFNPVSHTTTTTVTAGAAPSHDPMTMMASVAWFNRLVQQTQLPFNTGTAATAANATATAGGSSKRSSTAASSTASTASTANASVTLTGTAYILMALALPRFVRSFQRNEFVVVGWGSASSAEEDTDVHDGVVAAADGEEEDEAKEDAQPRTILLKEVELLVHFVSKLHQMVTTWLQEYETEVNRISDMGEAPLLPEPALTAMDLDAVVDVFTRDRRVLATLFELYAQSTRVAPVPRPPDVAPEENLSLRGGTSSVRGGGGGVRSGSISVRGSVSLPPPPTATVGGTGPATLLDEVSVLRDEDDDDDEDGEGRGGAETAAGADAAGAAAGDAIGETGAAAGETIVTADESVARPLRRLSLLASAQPPPPPPTSASSSSSVVRSRHPAPSAAAVSSSSAASVMTATRTVARRAAGVVSAVNRNVTSKFWDFHDLMRFCREFDVVPHLISRRQLQLIVNSVVAPSTSSTSRGGGGDATAAAVAAAIDSDDEYSDLDSVADGDEGGYGGGHGGGGGDAAAAWSSRAYVTASLSFAQVLDVLWLIALRSPHLQVARSILQQHQQQQYQLQQQMLYWQHQQQLQGAMPTSSPLLSMAAIRVVSLLRFMNLSKGREVVVRRFKHLFAPPSSIVVTTPTWNSNRDYDASVASLRFVAKFPTARSTTTKVTVGAGGGPTV